MRMRIIVPAIIVIGLLCALLMRPHPREIPAQAVPQPIISPEPKPVAPVQTDVPTMTLTQTVPAESPRERVLAKLREWDDDDRPDLREQRMSELAALLEG